MTTLLCAYNPANTIDANLIRPWIKRWKHNFHLHFGLQRGVFGTQHKQTAASYVGATTHFSMLLSLSPSE
jgi:hypothetical protein